MAIRIHQHVGSFVLLATMFRDAEVHEALARLGYTPCINRKLCLVSCPAGAIETGGRFHFSACYDHNDRSFMGCFADFVEDIVESRDLHDFRDRVPLSEAVTTWQALAKNPATRPPTAWRSAPRATTGSCPRLLRLPADDLPAGPSEGLGGIEG
jgi:ferredoxin